jgi:hypothetical protein
MPIPLAGKLLLGMAVATVVVMKDGVIEVNVQENHPNGSHVHLYVPATVATWGVHLAPEARLREHLRHEDRANLAIARVALGEMEKLPDVDLVQVESAKEHVNVAIHDGDFLVDVNDKGDVVHIRVPIRAARKVVEDLEATAPPET